MPLARASELDRLLACAGALVQPHADVRSAYVKAAADWGNRAHAWSETGEIPDAKIGERVVLSGIDRLALWPEGGLREVAVAYNVMTGAAEYKPDGTKEDKDAWKADHDDDWIVGTADYVGNLLGMPWVDDLKTGIVVSWSAYAAQQTFYSLCARVLWGSPGDSVRSTLTHWPRYPRHAPPRRSGVVLDVDKLDAFVVKLQQFRETVLAARATGETPLMAGSHCKYCPSKPFCVTGMVYHG